MAVTAQDELDYWMEASRNAGKRVSMENGRMISYPPVAECLRMIGYWQAKVNAEKLGNKAKYSLATWETS